MISIIIIVKNDKGIEKTLKGLEFIEQPEKTEVIVVDASNGKLDNIKDRYNNIAWIRYQKKYINKKYTIPEQRNIGMKKAQGDIVVFIDASCHPERDWLSELLKPIFHDNEQIVSGPTKSIGKETINDMSVKFNQKKKYLDECATNNMAFKKEVFLEVGDFDERFDYGSDVDFSWRCIAKGYKIRYVPSAIVSHDWGSLKSELKRTLLYGQARARLYIKHKARWKNLFTKDPVLIVYPTYILGLPLSLIIPYYPLVILLLVLKNINEKNPLGIVVKHIVYGIGALYECYLILTYEYERRLWIYK